MASEEVLRVRRQLAQMFRHTYEKRASVSMLYEVGKKLESRLDDIPEDEIPRDVTRALEFIHGLHDQSARAYHAENKEQIYHHKECLSE